MPRNPKDPATRHCRRPAHLQNVLLMGAHFHLARSLSLHQNETPRREIDFGAVTLAAPHPKMSVSYYFCLVGSCRSTFGSL